MRTFFQDVWGVLEHPRKQLAEIHTHRSFWSSFLLVFVHYYVVFGLWGGPYFARDPFPLYSVLFPILPAALCTLVFFLSVHAAVRLSGAVVRMYHRRRGSPELISAKNPGRYSDVVRVYGFTNLPKVLLSTGVLLSLVVYPPLLDIASGHLAVIITLTIVYSLVQIIWGLVLKVLALRQIYGLRDLRAIVNIVLAACLFSIFFLPVILLLGQMQLPPDTVRPYLQERYRIPTLSKLQSQVGMPTDKFAFLLRAPERFELISAATELETDKSGLEIDVSLAGMSGSRQSGRSLVRVLAVHGDRVAFRDGQLLINTTAVDEVYLTAPRPAALQLAEIALGPDQYLLLPDYGEVDTLAPWLKARPRAAIDARVAWDRRYPFGWILFRPEVFRRPSAALP